MNKKILGIKVSTILLGGLSVVAAFAAWLLVNMM